MQIDLAAVWRRGHSPLIAGFHNSVHRESSCGAKGSCKRLMINSH
jgi:hypothetical protein